MQVSNKETYENGEVLLDLFEDGRIFITVDHAGLFITPLQVLHLHDLLTAYLQEAVEEGELEIDNG